MCETVQIHRWRSSILDYIKYARVWWMFTCHGIVVAWSTYFPPSTHTHTHSRLILHRLCVCWQLETDNETNTPKCVERERGNEMAGGEVIIQNSNHLASKSKPQKATYNDRNGFQAENRTWIHRNHVTSGWLAQPRISIVKCENKTERKTFEERRKAKSEKRLKYRTHK